MILLLTNAYDGSKTMINTEMHTFHTYGGSTNKGRSIAYSVYDFNADGGMVFLETVTEIYEMHFHAQNNARIN